MLMHAHGTGLHAHDACQQEWVYADSGSLKYGPLKGSL